MFGSLFRACAVLVALVGPAAAEPVAFQSRINGQYVGTTDTGLLAANARGPEALVLDMVRLEGNRVAFRDPASGMFLRAGVGPQTLLAVASPHIRGWETFELIQTGADITLRSVQNGLFVGTDGVDARLAATWGTRGQGQSFRLVPIGAVARPDEAAPRVPSADLGFAGRWRLDALFDDGRMLSIRDRAMQEAQVTIARRGGVDGTTGCNQISARILESRSGFVVEDFLTTRVRCYGARADVERHLIDALTEATHFARIGSDVLEIRDSTGRLSARLRRL
ncbi:MAG: META domain-containing protein [Rhodobacteraceae bacterium]|jgi:hypothetical protein|nr:META domain-containing protein [Paracoccaceae bacterium]